jgi:glycerate kinase
MKVVVAPNAFKGTLNPGQAARAIEDGLRRGRPGDECDICPISDGGDGFLEALTAAMKAERLAVVVRGPVHAPVKAAFGLARERGGVLGIVESAQAAGLALVPPAQLDPLGASTGGLGELLAETRQAGATRMLVGLGGSATTDGGAGMARALGYRFLDSDGRELPEGGGSLHRLQHIDAGGFERGWLLLDMMAARDVDSPLLGAAGAAAVFAPQKGADAGQVTRLEEGLARLAEVAATDLGVDMAGLAGGGAAGGLGAGMVAFLAARLESGAASVLDTVGLDARLDGAGLLVTGEGRVDSQSLRGKATVEAGRRARRAGVRSVCITGGRGEGWEATVGDAFDQVVEMPPDGDPVRRLSAAAASLD